MKSGLRGVLDLLFDPGQQSETSNQIVFGEERREPLQPTRLNIGNSANLTTLNPGSNEEQVPKTAHQLAGKIARVIASRVDGIDQFEQLRRSLVGDRFNELLQGCGADQSERAANIPDCNRAAAECDHLIKGRLRIAKAARSGAGNLPQCLLFDRHTLEYGNLPQPVEDLFGSYMPELKLLAAREDSFWNLVQLSSGQNEDNVCRRFFERLEQRVEGAGREHMDLVDHEDLVAVTCRSQGEVVDDDFTHVVDASV